MLFFFGTRVSAQRYEKMKTFVQNRIADKDYTRLQSYFEVPQEIKALQRIIIDILYDSNALEPPGHYGEDVFMDENYYNKLKALMLFDAGDIIGFSQRFETDLYYFTNKQEVLKILNIYRETYDVAEIQVRRILLLSAVLILSAFIFACSVNSMAIGLILVPAFVQVLIINVYTLCQDAVMDGALQKIADNGCFPPSGGYRLVDGPKSPLSQSR